ncbi:hypothetical protein Q1695_015180 [Nippostrongylus brasiliensis]|nr:hypothetical protein Q1695_015180 [Nippostrongylus brasiliensis]
MHTSPCSVNNFPDVHHKNIKWQEQRHSLFTQLVWILLNVLFVRVTRRFAPLTGVLGKCTAPGDNLNDVVYALRHIKNFKNS